MRELFIVKIKQKLEEKQRAFTQDAAQSQQDKSFEEADMNKTGEMSKLSLKEDGQATGRKSTKQDTKREEVA